MHSLGNTDRIIMQAEYEQTTLDASGNMWFKHFNQKMDLLSCNYDHVSYPIWWIATSSLCPANAKGCHFSGHTTKLHNSA